MEGRELSWIHLPTNNPSPLTPEERKGLEALVWLERCDVHIAKQFARVVMNAIAACLELITWRKAGIQKDYVLLPAWDPRPLHPEMREILLGAVWMMRDTNSLRLSDMVRGMLDEVVKLSVQVDPTMSSAKSGENVLDFSRETQRLRGRQNQDS